MRRSVSKRSRPPFLFGSPTEKRIRRQKRGNAVGRSSGQGAERKEQPEEKRRNRIDKEWNNSDGVQKTTFSGVKTITPGGSRTPNRRFRRPVLYPIELQAPVRERLYQNRFFVSITLFRTTSFSARPQGLSRTPSLSESIDIHHGTRRHKPLGISFTSSGIAGPGSPSIWVFIVSHAVRRMMSLPLKCRTSDDVAVLPRIANRNR